MRIGASWDLRLWCIEGPAGELPLPVVFPRTGEALPRWAFGELPLDWFPPGSPETADSVPVFGRYAVSTVPGSTEGRLLGLRPRSTGTGASAAGAIPLRRGGAIRGVVPSGELWAHPAEGLAPMGARLPVIGVPQPLVSWRASSSLRVQVGFAVRDDAGQMYEGRDPRPIEVPGD